MLQKQKMVEKKFQNCSYSSTANKYSSVSHHEQKKKNSQIKFLSVTIKQQITFSCK